MYIYIYIYHEHIYQSMSTRTALFSNSISLAQPVRMQYLFRTLRLWTHLDNQALAVSRVACYLHGSRWVVGWGHSDPTGTGSALCALVTLVNFCIHTTTEQLSRSCYLLTLISSNNLTNQCPLDPHLQARARSGSTRTLGRTDACASASPARDSL